MLMTYTLTEWQLEAWACVPTILLHGYICEEDEADVIEAIGAEVGVWTEGQCKAFLMEVRDVALRHLLMELK